MRNLRPELVRHMAAKKRSDSIKAAKAIGCSSTAARRGLNCLAAEGLLRSFDQVSLNKPRTYESTPALIDEMNREEQAYAPIDHKLSPLKRKTVQYLLEATEPASCPEISRAIGYDRRGIGRFMQDLYADNHVTRSVEERHVVGAAPVFYRATETLARLLQKPIELEIETDDDDDEPLTVRKSVGDIAAKALESRIPLEKAWMTR